MDPDEFGRKEILSIVKSGWKPIAWLNVIQPEIGRTFSSKIDQKTVLMESKIIPVERRLAKFYLSSWRNLLLERIRELAQKGFKGVVLIGAGRYGEVTDNPISFTEMASLIVRLSREFKSMIPNSVIILENDEKLLSNNDVYKSMDGVLFSNLFFLRDGKTRHEWEKKDILIKFRNLKSAGKEILLCEQPRTLRHKESACLAAEQEGFNITFQSLPSWSIRSPQK